MIISFLHLHLRTPDAKLYAGLADGGMEVIELCTVIKRITKSKIEKLLVNTDHEDLYAPIQNPFHLLFLDRIQRLCGDQAFANLWRNNLTNAAKLRSDEQTSDDVSSRTWITAPTT